MTKITLGFALGFISVSVSWADAPKGVCTDQNIPIVNFHTVVIAGALPSENYDCATYKKSKALVYRGSRLTSKGVDALIQLGVKTDLDLETRDLAEAEKAYIHGRIKFYSVPMSGFVGSDDQKVKSILSIITNPDNYPIYIHCHRGIDRTGFATAMLRIFEGWDATRVIAEWNEYRDASSNRFAYRLYEWGEAQIKSYYEQLHPQ